MPGCDLISNPRRLAGCLTATFLYSCLFCLSLHLSRSTTILQHTIAPTQTSAMVSPETLVQAAPLSQSKSLRPAFETDLHAATRDQPVDSVLQQPRHQLPANFGQVVSSFFARLSTQSGIAFPGSGNSGTNRKLTPSQELTVTGRSILALNKRNPTVPGNSSANSNSSAMIKKKQKHTTSIVLPSSASAVRTLPAVKGGLTRASQGVTLDGYDYNSELIPFDPKIHLEGNGQLGIPIQIILDQLNNLSSIVPAVGSFASNKVQATGANTGLNQNSTVLVQEVPRRTAGQYSAGSAGIDPAAASSSAFGTSSSVAKDVVTPLDPISSFGSSGESVAVANASSAVAGQDSGTRTIVGGLSVAGRKSVSTVTGLVIVPNLNPVNVSERTGASSQNGVLSQGIGTNSAMFLQSSSLAGVSPGNKTLQALVDSVEQQLKQMAVAQGMIFDQSVVYQGILVALNQHPRVNADQVLELIAQDGDLADLILSGQILTVTLRDANQTVSNPGAAADNTGSTFTPGLHTVVRDSQASEENGSSTALNGANVTDPRKSLVSIADPYMIASGSGNATVMSVLAGNAAAGDSPKDVFGSDASIGSIAKTAGSKIAATPVSASLLSAAEQSNRKLGGGVVKIWNAATDLTNLTSNSQAYNTLASGSTFGATNLYGWTRSIIQGTARSFGTKIAQGEIKEGGFATGATTVNGNTASVTQLPQVICVQTKPQTSNLSKLAALLPDAVGKRTFVGGDKAQPASFKGFATADSQADCVSGIVNSPSSAKSAQEFNAASDTKQQSEDTPTKADSAQASNKGAKFLGAVLQIPDGL